MDLDLIKEIGDTLTTIDRAMAQIYYQATMASGPGRDRLQQRYNSLDQQRKHLDDQQRNLVKSTFDKSTSVYQQLADALGKANNNLSATLTGLADLDKALSTANQVISSVDQILQLIAKALAL
jgi:predicted transcriptional regulator